MQAKAISRTTKEAQKRFFVAFNDLISRKKIEGLTQFCREYNLHKPKYVRLRQAYMESKATDYRHVDMDAFIFIVRDYDVSAEWLLTGRGDMYE
jgi:hypothetical protein